MFLYERKYVANPNPNITFLLTGGEKCFKEGWMLFHFHHVCTRGGQDGLMIGLKDVPNDWSNLAHETGLEFEHLNNDSFCDMTSLSLLCHYSS